MIVRVGGGIDFYETAEGVAECFYPSVSSLLVAPVIIKRSVNLQPIKLKQGEDEYILYDWVGRGVVYCLLKTNKEFEVYSFENGEWTVKHTGIIKRKEARNWWIEFNNKRYYVPNIQFAKALAYLTFSSHLDIDGKINVGLEWIDGSSSILFTDVEVKVYRTEERAGGVKTYFYRCDLKYGNLKKLIYFEDNCIFDDISDLDNLSKLMLKLDKKGFLWYLGYGGLYVFRNSALLHSPTIDFGEFLGDSYSEERLLLPNKIGYYWRRQNKTTKSFKEHWEEYLNSLEFLTGDEGNENSVWCKYDWSLLDKEETDAHYYLTKKVVRMYVCDLKNLENTSKWVEVGFLRTGVRWYIEYTPAIEKLEDGLVYYLIFVGKTDTLNENYILFKDYIPYFFNETANYCVLVIPIVYQGSYASVVLDLRLYFKKRLPMYSVNNFMDQFFILPRNLRYPGNKQLNQKELMRIERKPAVWGDVGQEYVLVVYDQYFEYFMEQITIPAPVHVVDVKDITPYYLSPVGWEVEVREENGVQLLRISAKDKQKLKKMLDKSGAGFGAYLGFKLLILTDEIEPRRDHVLKPPIFYEGNGILDEWHGVGGWNYADFCFSMRGRSLAKGSGVMSLKTLEFFNLTVATNRGYYQVVKNYGQNYNFYKLDKHPTFKLPLPTMGDKDPVLKGEQIEKNKVLITEVWEDGETKQIYYIDKPSKLGYYRIGQDKATSDDENRALMKLIEEKINKLLDYKRTFEKHTVDKFGDTKKLIDFARFFSIAFNYYEGLPKVITIEYDGRNAEECKAYIARLRDIVDFEKLGWALLYSPKQRRAYFVPMGAKKWDIPADVYVVVRGYGSLRLRRRGKGFSEWLTANLWSFDKFPDMDKAYINYFPYPVMEEYKIDNLTKNYNERIAYLNFGYPTHLRSIERTDDCLFHLGEDVEVGEYLLVSDTPKPLPEELVGTPIEIQGVGEVHYIKDVIFNKVAMVKIAPPVKNNIEQGSCVKVVKGPSVDGILLKKMGVGTYMIESFKENAIGLGGALKTIKDKVAWIIYQTGDIMMLSNDEDMDEGDGFFVIYQNASITYYKGYVLVGSNRGGNSLIVRCGGLSSYSDFSNDRKIRIYKPNSTSEYKDYEIAFSSVTEDENSITPCNGQSINLIVYPPLEETVAVNSPVIALPGSSIQVQARLASHLFEGKRDCFIALRTAQNLSVKIKIIHEGNIEEFYTRIVGTQGDIEKIFLYPASTHFYPIGCHIENIELLNFGYNGILTQNVNVGANNVVMFTFIVINNNSPVKCEIFNEAGELKCVIEGVVNSIGYDYSVLLTHQLKTSLNSGAFVTVWDLTGGGGDDRFICEGATSGASQITIKQPIDHTPLEALMSGDNPYNKLFFVGEDIEGGGNVYAMTNVLSSYEEGDYRYYTIEISPALVYDEAPGTPCYLTR